MDEALMEQLRKVTEEEEKLLAGGSVEQQRYASGHAFMVDSKKLLERGKLITMRPHTRFTSFPRHGHNYVEIMYMCSGKTVHRINDGPPVVLNRGELLFMNQYAFHQVEEAGRRDIGINFIVLPSFFDQVLEMIGTDNVLGTFFLNSLRQKGGEGGYLHFHVAEIKPVQNLLENMALELVDPKPNGTKMNQVTMGLLCLELLRYTSLLESGGEKYPAGGLVWQVLQEIQDHYREADLTAFAREKGVSLSYLSTLIKKETGRSFKSLLLEKRMTKAAALLQTTALPVEEIIYLVGYENTSFFYRAFRERYGVSPKEYRNLK
jgi:AraC-like DNA-binding protein